MPEVSIHIRAGQRYVNAAVEAMNGALGALIVDRDAQVFQTRALKISREIDDLIEAMNAAYGDPGETTVDII